MTTPAILMGAHGTAGAAALAELARRAERLRAERAPFVLATVVRAERPTSAKNGDRALVLPDGTIEGFVGGTCAADTVREQALALLRTGRSTLLRISPAQGETPGPLPSTSEGSAAEHTGQRSSCCAPEPQAGTESEGMTRIDNPCLSGGTLDIFLEAVVPPALVHVFGDGPVARSLAEVGRAGGYDVRVTADPSTPIAPDTAAVVVASHGTDEREVLGAALRADVPYVGLIASRRRGAAVIAGLGAGAERISSPAGLDLGARTAPEIALSVLAEILSVRSRQAPARAAAGRVAGGGVACGGVAGGGGDPAIVCP